jgi:leucyl-tRNA synthetase
MPVDLYIGGAEHAVLHLLYARFWHKVFFDLGLVSQKEPFQRLFNQGMIVGTAYKTKAGAVVKAEDIRWESGRALHPENGEELVVSQAKMSKSLGNVVNPDKVVDEFGADALRLYEMFMGPLDQGKVWDTNGINGVARFLRRAWHAVLAEDGSLAVQAGPGDRELDRAMHRCLKQVGDDIEGLRFNTAISAMMIFLNALEGKALSRGQAEIFALVLAPFAPHLAEELWSKLGHAQSLAYEAWPMADESLLKSEQVELVLQFNGKLRSRLTLRTGLDARETERLALADPRIAELLAGKAPKKVIVVPDKLVNVVL